MAKQKKQQKPKKKKKGPGKSTTGFQPKADEGGTFPTKRSKLTEPAERRSGQLRGQEPHGQGSRQGARDPKDGGRPRGQTSRGR